MHCLYSEDNVDVNFILPGTKADEENDDCADIIKVARNKQIVKVTGKKQIQKIARFVVFDKLCRSTKSTTIPSRFYGCILHFTIFILCTRCTQQKFLVPVVV